MCSGWTTARGMPSTCGCARVPNTNRRLSLSAALPTTTGECQDDELSPPDAGAGAGRVRRNRARPTPGARDARSACCRIGHLRRIPRTSGELPQHAGKRHEDPC
ncbi:hypothetical protein G6F40_017092 [Rhizopus arrhizus]|nr:hypothetical protein G6F40_017092 [Rhizopus arrhizus]